VRLLEEAGVIDRYVAILNPSKIGKELTFFARIWLAAQDDKTVQHFVSEVRKLPEVLECHLMLGDCDAIARVAASDVADYRRFLSERLTRSAGVRSVRTDVPVQAVKLSTELPV
jgi:DNA-binding Lrp family transcriptional regulator